MAILGGQALPGGVWRAHQVSSSDIKAEPATEKQAQAQDELVEAIVAEDDDDDDDDEPKRRASRPRHEPLVQIQKNLETPDRGGRPPVVSSVSGYARAAKMVQDESAPTPVESMTYAAPVRARKVSCRLP